MPAGRTRRTLVSMSATAGESECRIERALGRSELCPGASCPFWEQGPDRPVGCVFGEVDLSGRKDVAAWVHDLRAELESLRPGGALVTLDFFERLNAGRSD